MDKYLDILIADSLKAKSKGEIPVSAIIVDKNGKIISREINNRQKKHRVTGHAEILAIEKACKKLKDWRLNDCTMYVSLYPCKMCREVINESRINKIYFLLENDEKVIHNEKYSKIINKEIENKYRKIFKEFFEYIR